MSDNGPCDKDFERYLLERYLALERLRLALEKSGDAQAAGAVLDSLDGIWYALSPAARRALDAMPDLQQFHATRRQFSVITPPGGC